VGKFSAQLGNIGPFDLLSIVFSTQYAGIAPAVTPTGATRNDVFITKKPDSSSAALVQACVDGQVFATGNITIFNNAGTAPSVVFNMSSIVIVAVNALSGNENLDLQFSQMTPKVTATTSDGGDSSDGGQ
jgi:type VI protein secretion system component Hcp